MRKRQTNPLSRFDRADLFTVKLPSLWLIVYWKSIGLTADGFSFYNDHATIKHALKDEGYSAKFDHGFDLRNLHTLPGTNQTYHLCACGCGLIATQIDYKWQLIANIEELHKSLGLNEDEVSG